jgi:hypothetical protein
MILGDLALIVANKVGMTDASTLALIKSWANRRHQMICDRSLWHDLLAIYTLSVSASQTEVILPAQITRYVAAKYDQNALMPVDQVFLMSTDPGIWDRTGNAMRVAELPASGTRLKPTSEKLALVSSNAADTAKTVTIVGELAGEEMSETLTLNGTTSVQSANSYDLIYTLSKQGTIGTVSVTGVTTAAALVTLQPTETERRHVRLRLFEAPLSAITLMVLGKRNAPALLNDSDQPAIRGVDGCLEAFVLADVYEWQRQGDDAAAKREEAMALLAQLQENEVYQAANLQQLVPYDAHDVTGSLTGKGYL